MTVPRETGAGRRPSVAEALGAERERIVAAIVADLERRMEGYSTAHFAMARHALGQVAADIPALVEGTINGKLPDAADDLTPLAPQCAFRRSLDAERYDQGFDVARLCRKPAIRRAVQAAAAAARDSLADLASDLRAVFPADHPPGAMASFADYIRTYRNPGGRT